MISIVVGAQFGGEGKGKVCAYIASHTKFQIVCRCGGVNSSHTVVKDGREIRLRMLPTAVTVNTACTIVFGAGTLIHIPTLQKEIELLKIDPGRIAIDAKAGVITEEEVMRQRSDVRYGMIGSTLTGTGYATAARALRQLKLASEFPELRPSIRDVSLLLYANSQGRRHILIEGHQGFGLSNYHGDYPYTSSRDATAAAMLSEIGLGPLTPGLQVILVAKAFPTRNHNGYLYNELTGQEAKDIGICERGGGSWGIPDNMRRVGQFDFKAMTAAARANSPTAIALTGTDYIDPKMRGATDRRHVSNKVWDLIHEIEKRTRTSVRYISTGPGTEEMIDLDRDVSLEAEEHDILPNLRLH